MREILFRGKRLDNGEWVYGAFCPKDLGDDAFGPLVDKPSIIKMDEPCSGFWFEVDPSTVGQFTGLRDKNGKRIFEGDVVKYTFCMTDDPTASEHLKRVIIGRVFFSDWRTSFSVTAGRKCSDNLNNDLFKYVRNGNRVEVIGNIHDNPELLEEDNDE